MEDYVKNISKVTQGKLGTVYTACGDIQLLENFKSMVGNFGGKAVDKWDLVDKPTVEDMKGLGFDQLGMIDLEVLIHAQYFLGYAGSSFSAQVGQTRHFAQFGNTDYDGMDKQQHLLGHPGLRLQFRNRLW
jgi:hypothetical protein